MDEKLLLDRITYDPKIFGGKPIIRGRRLAVEHVLGMLAVGDTIETVLAGYAWLEREDILACLAYAKRLVAHRAGRALPCTDRDVKLLLDSCVWGGAVGRLRAAGHVGWSGDWPADPGDEESLARALAQGRVLVTLDKDFGELAIVRELPHAGILRPVGLSALQQAEVTLRVIQTHGADLAAGAIITAQAGRLRVRLPGVRD